MQVVLRNHKHDPSIQSLLQKEKETTLLNLALLVGTL